MTRIIRIFFSVFFLFFFSVRSEGNSAKKSSQGEGESLQRIISSLQDYYRGVNSLCADFVQIFTHTALKRSQRAEGKFFYLRPGKLRFDYLKPEKKLFIFNAQKKVLWAYFPEDEEVQLKRNISLEQFGVAMQFLWGSGNLKRAFKIYRMKRARFGVEGSIRLKLVPRKPQKFFKYLFFALDPKTKIVRETLYIDPANNKNHFIFKGIKINGDCPLKAQFFTFKPPKGVEIIEN